MEEKILILCSEMAIAEQFDKPASVNYFCSDEKYKGRKLREWRVKVIPLFFIAHPVAAHKFTRDLRAYVSARAH